MPHLANLARRNCWLSLDRSDRVAQLGHIAGCCGWLGFKSGDAVVELLQCRRRICGRFLHGSHRLHGFLLILAPRRFELCQTLRKW